MVDILFNSVLPIFIVAAFGFVAGRVKLFDNDMAMVINRFVFYFPLPVLSFNLLASAHFEQFNWSLLIGYFLSEGVVYVCALVIARYLFKRGWPEAILLGVAAAYSNHVLFVLPIALSLFGDAVTLPIAAIIALDSLFMVGLTMVVMDIMTLEKPSISSVFSRLSKNPTIVALLCGLVFGLLSIELPKGINVFLDFVSATAAPSALFALGIVAFSLLFTHNFTYYLHQYYVHYPKELPYAWEYGFEEMDEYIKENGNQYDQIIISSRYDQPYILTAFFTQYPPDKFQEGIVMTPRDKFGFSTMLIKSLSDSFFRNFNFPRFK